MLSNHNLQRFAIYTGALLFTAACTTLPMNKFLKERAPGFRQLAPVSAQELRGTYLVDPDEMIPATNRCFLGELRAGAASFQTYTHGYSGGLAAGTALARDFGPALGVGGVEVSGGRTFNGSITLGKVSIHGMENVYFDPSGVCVQNDAGLAELRAGNKTYTVLTSLLHAEEISAASTDGSHLNLNLNFSEFGGKLKQESANSREWTGAKIYFAALPQMYRINVKEARKELAIGGELEVGQCAATLEAYSPPRKTWNATISCVGGENFRLRDKSSTDWAGIALPQGGVSYSLRVSAVPDQIGVFRVQMIQWTAVEVHD